MQASTRQDTTPSVVCSVDAVTNDYAADASHKAHLHAPDDDNAKHFRVNPVPRKSLSSKSTLHPPVDEAKTATNVRSGQPQLLVDIRDLSPISLTRPVLPTPVGERTAPGARGELSDKVVHPHSHLDTLSTPTAQDLPELDWADTPPLSVDCLSTPSPCMTPLTRLAMDDKVQSTPSTTILQSKRVVCIDERSPLRSTTHDLVEYFPSQHKTNDQKPVLLFPLHLYHSPSAQEAKNARIFDFAKEDLSRKHFNFVDSTQAMPTFGKADAKKTAAGERAVQSPSGTVRDHAQTKMRTENEATMPVVNAAHLTDKISAAHEDRPSLKKNTISATADLGTTLGLPEPTSKRFSRVLPFNAIERMIEAPRLCVASLLSWNAAPNTRCSKSTGLQEYGKNQLLAKLRGLRDPLNLSVSENYIQDLVNSLTCKASHRSIAKEQSKLLLDRYYNRCSSTQRKWEDFRDADLEFVMPWLKALTSIPGEQYSQHSQVATTTFEAAITRCTQAGSEEIHITGSVSSQPKQVSAGSDIVEKTTRTSVAQSLKSVTVPHSHEKQRISRQERQVAENVMLLTQTTQTTQMARATGKAERTREVDTSRTRTPLTQPKQASSKFVSTQIVDIDFVGSTVKVLTTDRTSLAKERTKVSYDESVNALHQQFHWFFNGASLNISIEECIAQCLRKPLAGKRDTEKGFIYMYWIVGSFDFVKIGLTSRSADVRLQEWKKKCGHDVQKFTTDQVGPAVRLPHVYRVEALVHAELREARLKEPECKKCTERKGYRYGHHEWFAVSAAHAQRVIRKWSDWMLTQPYAGGNLKSSISAKDMAALCTPLPLSQRDVAAFTALKPLTQIQPPLGIDGGTTWAGRLRPRKAS